MSKIQRGDKVRPLGNDEVYEVSKTMTNAWGQTFLSAYRQTPTGMDGLFINAAQVEIVKDWPPETAAFSRSRSLT